MRGFLCAVIGHLFVKFADGLKRTCSRCGREEWVFSNPYPRIGEPKYYWKHMPFEKFK